MTHARFKALFCDIGNVLLTNGWDGEMRHRAARQFGLDADEMDERHHLSFDTYEAGKQSLDEYLNHIVFFKPRNFTPQDFKNFMFAQTQAHPEMIELVKTIKQRNGLKFIVVSNEGRELTQFRVDKFHLDSFVDAFVCSAFVHFRKPDADIFRVALDIAHVKPEEVLYIDDRILFVEAGRALGIESIVHTDLESTKAKLASYGL